MMLLCCATVNIIFACIKENWDTTTMWIHGNDVLRLNVSGMVNNGHTGVRALGASTKDCWHHMKICPTTASKHICLFNSWKMERKQTSPPPPNKHTFYIVLKYHFEWRVYSDVTCLPVSFFAFLCSSSFWANLSRAAWELTFFSFDHKINSVCQLRIFGLSIYGFSEWVFA